MPIATSQGGRCEPGYFCPNGSSAMVECTPGQYCAGHALIEPDGPCDEGFYCISTSTTATPVDGVEGQNLYERYYCSFYLLFSRSRTDVDYSRHFMFLLAPIYPLTLKVKYAFKLETLIYVRT